MRQFVVTAHARLLCRFHKIKYKLVQDKAKYVCTAP
jgi:hypothetical protein